MSQSDSMKVVLQRVSSSTVAVDGETVGRIGVGLLLLVGVQDSDGIEEADAAARKISGLRIFVDDRGLMNRSVVDVGGEILVVSQFTILGNVRKGRRPSFGAAGQPEHADALIAQLIETFRREGIPTESGKFGSRMAVELVNDGPVTLVLEIKDGKVL